MALIHECHNNKESLRKKTDRKKQLVYLKTHLYCRHIFQMIPLMHYIQVLVFTGQESACNGTVEAMKRIIQAKGGILPQHPLYFVDP